MAHPLRADQASDRDQLAGGEELAPPARRLAELGHIRNREHRPLGKGLQKLADQRIHGVGRVEVVQRPYEVLVGLALLDHLRPARIVIADHQHGLRTGGFLDHLINFGIVIRHINEIELVFLHIGSKLIVGRSIDVLVYALKGALARVPLCGEPPVGSIDEVESDVVGKPEFRLLVRKPQRGDPHVVAGARQRLRELEHGLRLPAPAADVGHEHHDPLAVGCGLEGSCPAVQAQLEVAVGCPVEDDRPATDVRPERRDALLANHRNRALVGPARRALALRVRPDQREARGEAYEPLFSHGRADRSDRNMVDIDASRRRGRRGDVLDLSGHFLLGPSTP